MATLQEFQDGTKILNKINRTSRMKYLNIPEIEYYKMNIRYSEEIKDEAKTSRDLKKILSMDSIKKNVYSNRKKYK